MKGKETITSTESFIKDRGRNVAITFSVRRHGDKDEAGNLSLKGINRAVALGLEKDLPSGGIKFYVGTVPRVVATADAIIGGIEGASRGSKIFRTRKRLELAPPSWPRETREKLQDLEKVGGDAVFHYFMTEPSVQDDFKKWERGLAYLIERATRMAPRLYSGSQIELEAISHEGIIGHFLRDVAFFKDRSGQNYHIKDFDSVGGGIKTLEGFDLKVQINDKGEQKVGLVFRNEELEIDYERFNQLLAENKKTPYKGRGKIIG